MVRDTPARATPLTPAGWSSNEDYLFAVDLFNAGYYWEAHTFWERLWAVDAIEPATREFLQGLVQLAAACLKRRQGELAGARKLLGRARASLHRARAERTSFLGLDGSRVAADVERFLASGEPSPEIELVSS